MSIRTNNDTEASHRSLNKRIGECHINMYKLIGILHSDAQCSRFTCALVDLQKVNRQQKTQFKRNNDRLVSLMNQYHDGDIENTLSANDLKN